MVLRNKDGSVYKPTGTLSQLVPDSQIGDLFNSWDQELIQAGGSPLLYYEVIIPISSIDKLYYESRDKIWPQQPIEIFGLYDPIPSQMNQGLFGIDGPDDIVFYCNYKYILDKIGHLPVIGSRIYSPHLQENWEIVDRKLGNFFRWKVYQIAIHCTRFQETLTTGEGKVTQSTPSPSFEID